MIAIDDEVLKNKIMSRFKSIYINEGVELVDKDGIRNLLWCNIKQEYERSMIIIKTIDIPRLEFPSELPIYIYSDREEILYQDTFSGLCSYLLSLERWEYTDAEVFDDSLEWFIGISHDDRSILVGFNDD